MNTPIRERMSKTTLDVLTPLIDCATERAGWIQCVEIAHDLLDVDIVVAIEFTQHERAVVRAGIGFEVLTPGLVIPIAPDSQAAYAHRQGGICVSGDLPTETRFTPSGFLVREGIRSSVSITVDLPDDQVAMIGVHSRRLDHFDDADVDALRSLIAVFGSALARLRRSDELALSAIYDPLTRLMNRATIMRHLDESLESGSPVAVLLIDLDGFKTVNDLYGHGAGDQALKTIAKRFERCMGARGKLGRIGGDEFLAIVHDSDGETLAGQLIGHAEELMAVQDSTVQLSASIGVARRRVGDDATGLLERADRLMYTAKSHGRGQAHNDVIVDPRPVSLAPARRSDDPVPTLDDVEEAIAGLTIVVQPVVDARTKRVRAVEALTRGPDGHLLESPDRLFAAATTFSRLGDLELASKRLAFDLELDPGVDLYLNVEPMLPASESWMAQLRQAWHASDQRASITVEIAERSVLQSPGRLLAAVDACRSLGWKIALDDVGGRSENLAALRWIDPDVVKIDMGLVGNDNPAHAAHVVASVSAFRSADRRRDVTIIAEGVETIEHTRAADVLGADLLQGHLFARPTSPDRLDIDAVEQWGATLPQPQRVDGDRTATKDELVRLSRQVEASAQSSDCVLLASVQHRDHVTERTRRQYEGIARRCGFVGMIGHRLSELDDVQLRGVRLADIDAHDPMARSWQVIALSPDGSIGLLATELDTDDGDDRRFSYEIITRPSEVEAAARNLLRHF
ncbi:diguanylate cyclase domain-containing protein [Ilumatobacter coccineus]|uniref:GGDEF domain-containing protein n=1 Tax=Ilumatobacter coccineus (strain NBRC 103263 / KCTC 29153 / YM16-304) TaxID=1313172 RepID=A0A6C7ECZ8_ILUCY|nr:diguanylate cyclase [Ilumatobacter coccineus]BAN01886.1 hypothetical protein YM304_15720 [Ilumatobacter coccineus YM16-304]